MSRKGRIRLYHYIAYGLGISSALPLPELKTSAEVAADVTIDLGTLNWSPSADALTEDGLVVQFGADEAYFCWEALGKFRVRGGREILIDPVPGVQERLLRLPLLGTILAVLLHQRAFLVLHASAVAIDGEAIIFLGNKGYGKSTMAAMLYARGHELIADDIVALRIGEAGPPIVISGYPQFKLYPEAASCCLGDDPEKLPEIADGYEKRSRRVTDRFALKPLPLKAVYVLGRGEVSRVLRIGPQDAVLTLIANTYMARFGKQLLHGAYASSHLRQCARVLSQVPMRRLERPDSLALLPTIAQLVEENRHSGIEPV
jgi:HPr Serine kinase C-terminal domain